MKEVLQVAGLSVQFITHQGIVCANREVSLSINEGETAGLMGESGCGKTVLALAMLRLQQPGQIVAGEIFLDGQNITAMSEPEIQQARGSLIGLVPQDHGSALNPLQTVGFHLAEAIHRKERSNRLSSGEKQKGVAPDRTLWERSVQALEEVGLPEPERQLRRYPHQLSGGMRQRVLVAMALLLEPRLLICDEPTTALDKNTKEQILALLESARHKTTMLLISHDLAAIQRLCDRVAVMYAGSIVEEAGREELLRQPLHPYSQALLASQRLQRGLPLVPIAGDVPDLIEFPSGCAFHPRCPAALEVCRRIEPSSYRINGRNVECHLYA
jgi:oligopeptide/dipeptide ABC transporter ATP-binding protein